MLLRTAEPFLPKIRLSRWLAMLAVLIIGGSISLEIIASLRGYGVVLTLLLVLALFVAFHLFTKIAFQQSFDLFEPVHWVFLFGLIGYVATPLYMMSTGQVSYLIKDYSLEVQTQLMIHVLVYIIVGFICFYVGYNTLIARRIGASLPLFGTTWSSRRTRHVVILFTLIGAISFAAYAHYGGGILFLYRNPTLRWYIFQDIPAGGYLEWGIQFFPLAIYIWFIYYLKVKRNRVFWLYTLVVSALMLMLGGRGRILGIWVTLLVLYHYLGKRLSIRRLVGFVILVFVFLLFFSMWMEGDSEERFAHFTYLFSGEYFGGLAPFMHIVKHVPSDIGPYFGQTFLSLFAFPIPRVVWPEKPTTAGRIILLPYYPEQGGGVGTPLVAELYLNFLIPGIIVGMLLFGVIVRTLYTYLKKNMRSRATVLLYSAVFLPWIIGLTSADFVTTTVPMLETLIVLCLALSYITRARVRKTVKRYHMNKSLPGIQH